MKTGREINQIKRRVRKAERQQVIAEVLEIIDRLDAEAVEDFELDTDYGLAVVHDRFKKARKKIKEQRAETRKERK